MGTNFTVRFNEYMPLRDLVFTTLRQAILKGELLPGERLMEIQLAEKMGVSRTPIREAIRKLEREGLVIMVPRKGAEVAGISEKMLRDVLEVRMTLEKLALRLAFKRQGTDLIEKLEAAEQAFQDAIEGEKLIDMAEADEHRELLNSLKENMYRYRLEYLKDENYRRSLMEEHNAIIEAFKTNDLEKGLDVTDTHIANQERAVIGRVRQENLEREKKPKKK